jgi:uncharacterized membrane protein YccF (DUF307 family)
MLAAVLLAITIIGLPVAKQSIKLAGYALWPFGRTLGVASFKMAGAALVPFGKQVVNLSDLGRPPENAIVVGSPES